MSIVAVLDSNHETREHLRKFLAILLPHAEIRVFEEANVCAAAVTKYPVDLLIVGDQIKGSSTVRFLEYLPRTRRPFPTIAIVGPSEAAWNSALKAGADDVVMQPIDDMILKSKIETLLSGLYTSPFAFFGTGKPLGKLRMNLDSRVFDISPAGVEMSSPVSLAAGSMVTLSLMGQEIQILVDNCRKNPHREDSYFLSGKYLFTDLKQEIAFRKLLLTQKHAIKQAQAELVAASVLAPTPKIPTFTVELGSERFNEDKRGS